MHLIQRLVAGDGVPASGVGSCDCGGGGGTEGPAEGGARATAAATPSSTAHTGSCAAVSLAIVPGLCTAAGRTVHGMHEPPFNVVEAPGTADGASMRCRFLATLANPEWQKNSELQTHRPVEEKDTARVRGR